jgi:succinate dehydrogenase hydrophobic anchor subunit
LAESPPERPRREGAELAANRRFVETISRWALALTVLLLLYDVAVLRRYPFPDAISVLRAPFYTTVGVALVLATLFCTFLGYRIISMRYARRTRAIYVIFFPAVVLICSLFWFIVLS